MNEFIKRKLPSGPKKDRMSLREVYTVLHVIHLQYMTTSLYEEIIRFEGLCPIELTIMVSWLQIKQQQLTSDQGSTTDLKCTMASQIKHTHWCTANVLSPQYGQNMDIHQPCPGETATWSRSVMLKITKSLPLHKYPSALGNTVERWRRALEVRWTGTRPS